MPNYDLIMKKHKENMLKPEGMLAVVVGLRGSGKSGLCATFGKDKKVLLAFYNKENHSIMSAQAVSRKNYGTDEQIIPYMLDQDEAGNQIYDADKVFVQTLEVFTSAETGKMFDVVYLDGLSALDPYIHATSDVRAASKYDVSKTVLQKCGMLMQAIKDFIRRTGKSVVLTCASEASTNDEGVATETPKLRGSGAASAILGECPNILSIQMIMQTGQAQSSRLPYFVFNTNIAKNSQKITGIDKDDKGATVISSASVTTNFFPRLARLTTDQTPHMIPASFEELIKIQNELCKKV